MVGTLFVGDAFVFAKVFAKVDAAYPASYIELENAVTRTLLVMLGMERVMQENVM